MRLLRLLGTVMLLGGMAFSQASFYSGTAQTTQYINGQQAVKPLPNASIFVCTYPGACTIANAATLYTDATGTTTGPNPVTADAFSNFGFWATPGNYQYIITGVNGTSYGPYTASVGGSSSSSGAVPKTSLVANLPVSPTPSQGTIYQALDGQRGQYTYNPSFWHPVSTDINVQDFGARGDGGMYSNVSCSNGSATVSNVFVSYGRLPKVGDSLVASGCGAAGADLSCTISGGSATSGTNGGTAICGGGVSAGATLSSRGARWGGSVDDTSAFAAAISYCGTVNPAGIISGCKIRVPQGVYFISNVTFPVSNGAGIGAQVIIQGVGRSSSMIFGIGANQTAIFTAPANSVPTQISDMGISSYDPANSTQIAVNWLGGTEHTLRDVYAFSVYEMIRATNTWLDRIDNNRCYSSTNCIHFGPAGIGPVNATLILNNELSTFSNVGILSDATGSGGTQQNTYVANNCENAPGPYVACMDVNDTGSSFSLGFMELVAPTPGPYYSIFRGGSNIVDGYSFNCIQVAGGSNIFRGGAGSLCPAHTYTVKNDGLHNTFQGANWGTVFLSAINDAAIISGPTAAATGATFYTGSGAFSVTPYVVGGAQDWTNGRVDVAGTPTGRSQSVTVTLGTANPTYPNNFGTAAVIPFGTIVANTTIMSGPTSPINNNVWWLCISNPCATNPLVASDWRRIGEIASKVRQEASAAPVGGILSYTVGDFLWNTNPASNGILGWICTAAGTPGTWAPIYANNAVMNTSGTVQAFSHQVIGSATLTSGTPSTVTVTLTGSAVYTSSATYKCSLTNETTQANPVKISYSSGSAFVITGPNTVTDVIGFVCTGN